MTLAMPLFDLYATAGIAVVSFIAGGLVGFAASAGGAS